MDDLDAFFEEVSEAEANVESADNQLDQAQQSKEVGHDNNDDNIAHLPPSKKAKTTTADATAAVAELAASASASATASAAAPKAAPPRPRGVVVASSTSVVTKKDHATITATSGSSTTTTDYNRSKDVVASYTSAVVTHQPLAPPYFPSQPNPMMVIGTKSTILPAAVTALPNNNQQQPFNTAADGSVPLNSNNNGSTVKAHKRKVAGKVWVDPTLGEWPENDFRLFVGNLSRDVTDQQLYDHFARYPSLAKVRIVRDPKGTSKGYGFCSFLQPIDYAKALREMDQTWLSSRPIRIKRSDWRDQELKNVVKKEKKIFKQQHR